MLNDFYFCFVSFSMGKCLSCRWFSCTNYVHYVWVYMQYFYKEPWTGFSKLWLDFMYNFRTYDKYILCTALAYHENHWEILCIVTGITIVRFHVQFQRTLG